jgi:hypothetical protein
MDSVMDRLSTVDSRMPKPPANRRAWVDSRDEQAAVHQQSRVLLVEHAKHGEATAASRRRAPAGVQVM